MHAQIIAADTPHMGVGGVHGTETGGQQDLADPVAATPPAPPRTTR